MDELPFSPACERNKNPIMEVLRSYNPQGKLIEMGFGTAQHCTFFSSQLPELEWYACDHPDYHPIFEARKRLEGSSSLLKGPYTLLADQQSFREQCRQQNIPLYYDYFFTANTLHIMNKKSVEFFCRHVGEILKPQGYLFLYGPFRFQDRPFAQSNLEFHHNLLSRGVDSGIRDYEWIESLLEATGLHSVEAKDLPSNNSFLIFQKR